MSALVTYEAYVTNRKRTINGDYVVVPVVIEVLAEDDDDDNSLSLVAFDVVHSSVAEPVGGMILSFRLISSVE